MQPKSFMILPQEPYRSKASVSAKVSQKLDAKIDYEKDFKLLYDGNSTNCEMGEVTVNYYDLN